MGILQCCMGHGMPSPAPESYFPFLRAKPSRLTFQLCEILKSDFKQFRITVESKGLLVLKWAVESGFERGKALISPYPRGRTACSFLSYLWFSSSEELSSHMLTVLPALLGCASTSSVPVTQCKCNAVLGKPQGLSLHWKEWDGALKPSWQVLAAFTFTLVCLWVRARSWPRECRGVGCAYSELWHLGVHCNVTCSITGSTWGRKFKPSFV